MARNAEPQRLPFTAAAQVGTLEAGTLEVLLAGGERKKLTDADRRDLLAKVRAGEHVELTFKARTFVQRDGETNRNFVRFKPGMLGKFAKSFAGQVFLRDHGQHSLDDRGGTILSAELVKGEGEAAIDMELRAVKPWAVEGVLDGTIDRFSIGWTPTEPVLCSVHKKPLRGLDGCRCWPGDVVDGETVEALFTGADGVEVSAVNVPAIPDARGVEIRAALSAWAGDDCADAAPKEKDMKTIATLLGLAVAASEDDILAATARLKDEREAAIERADALQARLSVIETEKKAAETAALAEHVEARIRELKANGSIALKRDAQGELVMSGGEKMLRSAAARGGRAEFDAAASDFVPGTFAASGAPPQLKVEEKVAPLPAGAELLNHPEVKARLEASGVTVERVLKSNGLGMFAGQKG